MPQSNLLDADLICFVSGLIALRKAHPVLSAELFYSDPGTTWLGANRQPARWQGQENRIGCLIFYTEEQPGPLPLALLFNAGLMPCRSVLPWQSGGPWRIAVDTSRASPDDFSEAESRPVMSHAAIELEICSAMVFIMDP